FPGKLPRSGAGGGKLAARAFLIFFRLFPKLSRENGSWPDPGLSDLFQRRKPIMNEPHDLNQTADLSSVESDSLDAGLAAGFGRQADGPGSVLSALRPSLGDLRPVLLKEAQGESAHVVKPKSDATPPPEQTGNRYQLQGEIARGGMGAVLRGRD